ncbi:MAG: AAA family ATPase [Hahellaceae bacterium]|nr:AAA family ATPase [Hahellaceae bacterium]
MYQEFYGLKELPFNLLPDPDFLFLGSQYRQALSMLEYGLTKDGFTVITGDIGTGKTTLIRKILERDDSRFTVGLLNNTVVYEKRELLRWILFSFGVSHQEDGQVGLYDQLTRFLIKEYKEGRQCVMIIDEAQKLDIDFLEQIRMISNINYGKHLLIQFILVGQPELRIILRRPELHQFAQRISVDYHLKRLSELDTHSYIMHRLSVAGGDPFLFDDAAKSLIWKHSGGMPRLINVLCDTSLVYGYAVEVKKITSEIVGQVISDKEHGLSPIREEEFAKLDAGYEALKK